MMKEAETAAAAAKVEPIKRLDTVHSQGSDSSQSESVTGKTDPPPAQRSYRYIAAFLVLILCIVVVVVSVLLAGGKESSSSSSNKALSSEDLPSSNAIHNDTNNKTTILSSPSLFPIVAPTIEPGSVTAPSPMDASEPAPSPISSFQPILLNAGGFLYTDSHGHVWQSDENVRTTGRTYNDTCPPTSLTTAIDRALYCSGRVHVEGYEIPVPNGYYAVTLHFYYGGENATASPALNVYLEGQLALTDPGNRELFVLSDESTRVMDGYLSVQFVKESGSSSTRISALEVDMAAPSSTDDFNSNSTETNSTMPEMEQNITYTPGLLVTDMVGLLLSQGLTARIIATSGQPVQYHDGTESTLVFHDKPDAAATFPDERPGNPGGWIYVSNSEGDLNTTFPGGVGAITFDADGNVVDYRSVLAGGKSNSWANCGGGRTPWGTWVSGEEKRQGRIFQVDPTGERLGEPITMGNVNSGRFESFAYDSRNLDVPRFFMTKDDLNGELRRLYVCHCIYCLCKTNSLLNCILYLHSTPTSPNWTDPWTILTGEGTIDYLVITFTGNNTGTFDWDTDFTAGSANAAEYFVRNLT
jgi:Malectin domain/Bacterial protein of unknown function (DUF839)